MNCGAESAGRGAGAALLQQGVDEQGGVGGVDDVVVVHVGGAAGGVVLVAQLGSGVMQAEALAVGECTDVTAIDDAVAGEVAVGVVEEVSVFDEAVVVGVVDGEV